MKIQSNFATALLSILMLSSCVKEGQLVTNPQEESNPLNINAPSDFNWETYRDVNLNVTLLTNNDLPVKNVLVNLMDKPAEDGGMILFTALTDDQGKITTTAKLPSYLEKVIVDPQYIGLMRNAVVRIESKQVLCTIGGTKGYSGNIEEQGRSANTNPYVELGRENNASTYKYMGTYTNDGKPNYLETPNDVITAGLLATVNASLPESKPVPTYHPAYLQSTSETNLNLNALADIWITFVHEGAGYYNTLAYFTYPTNNPPTSTNDIDTVRIILPNASLNGSGGKMESGNKVKLGRFPAGTSVGFCLIANGWNSSSKTVGSGLNKFFSIDALNPETSAANKRHTVLLKDNVNNLFLVGFEDQRRDQGSDNDFNDLVFYATANPVTAITATNILPVATANDSDGDGVNDDIDQFPTDPTRAYINYYPSQNTYGSIGFEDTWPSTGDYDLNDVIVDYRYKFINNAANNTVEFFADYALKASGAQFKNGFGVQMPFAPSLVSSVTGSRATNGVTTFNANGTEAGQSKAVIIPFDDFYSVMSSSNNQMINTAPGIPYIKPDTIKMKVSFVNPITSAQLGTAPFNQFLIANKNRNKEVHLPGDKPTDKAATALFGTADDNTNPAQNRYYKTKSNLPYAISLPQSFEYPIEAKAINIIYLKFNAWAQSGGVLFPDWYQKLSGYRLGNYFYKP